MVSDNYRSTKHWFLFPFLEKDDRKSKMHTMCFTLFVCMKNFRAFTLFEMLIVIIIIGILTSMTFYFGTERIRDLDRQTLRDRFVDTFNTTVGKTRMASYLYGQHYTSLHMYIFSGAHGFQIGVSWTMDAIYTGFDLNTLRIDRIGKKPYKYIDVSLQPYSVWCTILADKSALSWIDIQATVVNQSSCFYLDAGICSLKKIPCL